MTDSLLEAIAEHGEREHVLRELEARNSMGELTARDVAREQNVENQPVETIAKTFIDSWDIWKNDTDFLNYNDDWRDSVEDKYGEIADQYI